MAHRGQVTEAAGKGRWLEGLGMFLGMVLATLGGVAGTADASTLLEIVGNPPSMHPFSGRLLTAGPEAAYFNPALTVEVPQQFTLGLFYLWEDHDVDLDPRAAGADVPEDIY